MTREEVSNLLALQPIMRAYAEGKEVQARWKPQREGDRWDTVCEPDFNDSRVEWRIKPEPLVIWANVYDDNKGEDRIGVAYISKDTALAYNRGTGKLTKFVEEVQ